MGALLTGKQLAYLCWFEITDSHIRRESQWLECCEAEDYRSIRQTKWDVLILTCDDVWDSVPLLSFCFWIKWKVENQARFVAAVGTCEVSKGWRYASCVNGECGCFEIRLVFITVKCQSLRSMHTHVMRGNLNEKMSGWQTWPFINGSRWIRDQSSWSWYLLQRLSRQSTNLPELSEFIYALDPPSSLSCMSNITWRNAAEQPFARKFILDNGANSRSLLQPYFSSSNYC